METNTIIIDLIAQGHSPDAIINTITSIQKHYGETWGEYESLQEYCATLIIKQKYGITK